MISMIPEKNIPQVKAIRNAVKNRYSISFDEQHVIICSEQQARNLYKELSKALPGEEDYEGLIREGEFND